MSMLYRTAVLIVVATTVLAVPAQAGIEDQLQVSFPGDASPDEVHGLNNTLYFGDERREIREAADEDGNGEVSEAEADAYVADVRSEWENDPPQLEWTLDGHEVSQPEDPRVQRQGLATSVDDDQTVSIRIDFNATFSDASHGNEHTLVIPEFQDCRGAGGAGFPPEWSVGFMEGHSVDSVNVETESQNERIARIPCQEGDPPQLEVTFTSDEPVESSGTEDPGNGGDSGDGDDGGERSSPAAGALLAAACALLAGWGLGRRN
jgi:hypothetical protein